MHASLIPLMVSDAFFEPDVAIPPCEIKVPSDYAHRGFLDGFALSSRKLFETFHSGVSDENYPRTAHRLLPARRYAVSAMCCKVPLVRRYTLAHCLKYQLEKEHCLVGPRGLALVWQQHPDMFKAGNTYLSFDHPDYLFKVGQHEIKAPTVGSYVDKKGVPGYSFLLLALHLEWQPHYRFLRFELKA